jgi:aldehyde:ferredoxin oxidoreductase
MLRRKEYDMYGYIGKMLFVDLTTKTYEVRDLDEKAARD